MALSISFRESSMVKVEPLPCSLSAEIWPPIISMMFLVMAMPSPVPSTLLTVAVRSRSKGSKTWGRKSLLMPMPVSRMESTKLPYLAEV